MWCISLFAAKIFSSVERLVFLSSSCLLLLCSFTYLIRNTAAEAQRKVWLYFLSLHMSNLFGPDYKNVPKPLTETLCQRRTKSHLHVRSWMAAQRFSRMSRRWGERMNEWMNERGLEAQRETSERQRRPKGSHGWLRGSRRQRVCGTVVLQIVSGSLWRGERTHRAVSEGKGFA